MSDGVLRWGITTIMLGVIKTENASPAPREPASVDILTAVVAIVGREDLELGTSVSTLAALPHPLRKGLRPSAEINTTGGYAFEGEA